LLVIAASARASYGQVVDGPQIYVGVLDTYVKTGDVTTAVVPLLRWKPKDLEVAIDKLIASGDATRMRAATVLHLEIGVALVGLNLGSAKLHLDMGEDLLGKLRETYKSKEAMKAHDTFRAIWLAVAGSTYLAVKDIVHARLWLGEAHNLASDSAHVMTVYGILDEVDAQGYNPDDWQTLVQRERNQRERIIRLGRAERAYRAALAIDPHYSIASARLGRILQLNGKLKEARESLERATVDAKSAFQEYVAALYLGAVQQEQKDVESARRSFEHALSIVPGSQTAVVALAHLELMAGRPDRAQALARNFAAKSASDTWWAYKDGVLDLAGLSWLRQRVRQ
jgi:tetratricopeptide (TPR) repeat protein